MLYAQQSVPIHDPYSEPVARLCRYEHAGDTGEYLDDNAITSKVKSTFVADKAVSALDIKVTTYKGMVQLSGFANAQEEIDRALEMACNCMHFIAGSSTCQVVEGKVSPNGRSMLWARKA